MQVRDELKWYYDYRNVHVHDFATFYSVVKKKDPEKDSFGASD